MVANRVSRWKINVAASNKFDNNKITISKLMIKRLSHLRQPRGAVIDKREHL